MNEFEWQFGERFRKIRKLAGLSQEEFGKVLDVSRQTINAYENDRQRPTMDMMQKVCDLQNVNPNWLLTGTGETKRSAQYTFRREGGQVFAVGESGFTPEQHALMNFIAEDPERAAKLSQLLMSGGLESL